MLACMCKVAIVYLLGHCRLAQPSWLVQTNHRDQLVYFVNEHSLSVTAFNLSQDEFVGKVRSVCLYIPLPSQPP